MNILPKGLIQIYTGTGKGKTTAALGLCWRMLGWGGKVYVCQFLKPADKETGEATFAQRQGDMLRFERLAANWDMVAAASDSEQVWQMRGEIASKLREIEMLAADGEYDLIVLDELLVCLDMKLVDLGQVIRIVEGKAEHTELVLTGRGAPAKLLEYADLVTKMEEVKHPFTQGTPARQGVEY